MRFKRKDMANIFNRLCGRSKMDNPATGFLIPEKGDFES
jgi:hypothetical protein